MLYHINKKDIRRASQALGRSFIDYPIFTYIIPDRTSRKKKIEFLFTFLINLGMLSGEVIAPSSNIEGVSIWINSSSPKPSTFRVLWLCLIPLLLKVDPCSAYRFIKVGMLKEKKRKELLKDSYYLLDIIGVNPNYQNQGHARRMIESKLKEYDNLSYSCYLETSDKSNINFYEKFNFRLCHKYKLFTVNIYCLFREGQLSKRFPSGGRLNSDSVLNAV
jgi:ribosomal protein S18 acetylase RimI-like enzyme